MLTLAHRRHSNSGRAQVIPNKLPTQGCVIYTKKIPPKELPIPSFLIISAHANSMCMHKIHNVVNGNHKKTWPAHAAPVPKKMHTV